MVRELNAINRRFYSEHARAFGATREDPWPGWERLWEIVVAEGLADGLEVLDVGCGNGRFGRLLAARVPGLRYCGVDASAELLAAAREKGGLGEAPELRLLDFVEQPLARALAPQPGARRFSLVTLFGVLHHVPGEARRRQLVAEALSLLRPGGLLCATLWRFHAFARFRERIVPWEEHNRTAETPIDPAQLERGDHLLRWGEGEGVRYCHFADEAEVARLLTGLPAERVADFESDGREGTLNRYLVLRPRGQGRSLSGWRGDAGASLG